MVAKIRDRRRRMFCLCNLHARRRRMRRRELLEMQHLVRSPLTALEMTKSGLGTEQLRGVIKYHEGTRTVESDLSRPLFLD